MAGVIWNKRTSKQLQELQEYLKQEFGVKSMFKF